MTYPTSNWNGRGGFTLLELMVAMLLVSMVTVIIATAFRLGINAWDRAQREGDSFQARVVIPSLLQQQMDAVVRERGFVAGQAPRKLPFTGTGTGFSFFTAYTPMGGSQKGLVRVTYSYDTDKKQLLLYQQLILSTEDLEDTLFPLSDSWNGELEPSGSIPGVGHFRVGFSTGKQFVPTEERLGDEEWKPKNQGDYPASVLVEFGYKGPGIDSTPEVWHFTMGS